MAGPKPVTPTHEARIREQLRDPSSTFAWGDMAAVIERLDWLQDVTRERESERLAECEARNRALMIDLRRLQGEFEEARNDARDASERTRQRTAERDEARGQVERVTAVVHDPRAVDRARLILALAIPDQPTTEGREP